MAEGQDDKGKGRGDMQAAHYPHSPASWSGAGTCSSGQVAGWVVGGCWATLSWEARPRPSSEDQWTGRGWQGISWAAA